MHEMSQAIHEISSNVQKTAGQADHSRDLASQGGEIAQITRGSIEELRNSVSAIGAAVQQLAEQTGAIAQAAESIEVISEQTNLLALNAAIEAARAGEQGRGFSVVADEVRTLAGRTQSSTAEIHAMISHLQEAAARAAQVMKQGQQQAVQGVEKSAKANDALAEIIAQIMSMNDMNTQIASAAEEQSSVAEEMNQNLNRINMAADETAQAADDVAATSQDIALLSEQLKHAVDKFKV
eukprot:Anaeramoba_flamelloidesa567458_14.p1 GENE.a567458_14~~a567458_14.p1  ORF type:complete len:238 (+),score=43.28 a567458_14:3-716(+)